jgi:PAS domain S-box-containing protein
MLANQRQSYSMEKRYIHKDSHLVWVKLTVSLVRDQVGTPKYFITVVEDISLRKQAEKQLREMAQFLGETHNPILRLRADGLLLYANDNSLWLLEEWKSNIGNYAPEIWRKWAAETLATSSVRRFEIEDYAQVWTFLVVPSYEESYVTFYGQNITEERNLARKNARLATLVDFSNDAIIGKTLDGIITSWNKGAEKIYGYLEPEVLGKSVSLLTAPGYEDDIKQVLEKIEASEYVENYETIRKRKDGELIHIALSVSPVFDQSGQVVAASAISQDITERYKSQEELHRYAERLAAINRLDRVISSGIGINQIYDNFVKELHTLFNMDRTAIVLLNEIGNQWQIVRQWTSYNPLIVQGNWFPVQGSVIEWLVEHRTLFFEREVGEKGDWPETAILKREGIRSRWLFPLIIEEKVIGLLSVGFLQPDALSEKDQTILETIVDQLAIAVQNSRLYEQLKLYSVELEQRVLQRTADLEEEIARRELVEEELRNLLEKEKEVGKLKSRFISMTSHEFRTPLSIILSYSEMLEYYSEQWTQEKRKNALHDIQGQVQHLTTMLDDILTVGKAESGTMEFNPAPHNLINICEGVLNEITHSERVMPEIHFVNNFEPDIVLLDEKLIKHILINLLTNAIKYSEKGSPIYFSLSSQIDKIVIEVKDLGIGIPEEDQTHIFETFHRATNVLTIPGTGLGLAIVKKSVELHDGEINFSSKLGQGSTFTVTLPLNILYGE